jgi:branched-subunit amino acid aminotransferase/4-amino-4-deoxychorismate lyase
MDTEPTIDSVFLRHKTTQRALYTAARERMKDGVFDVVLWNNDHQVTETSIANLAIGSRMSDGGYMWKTPSLVCGIT